MANIKCNGQIETDKLTINENINIYGTGIEIGRKDSTPCSPCIEFYTDGGTGDFNSKILATGKGLEFTAEEGLKLNDNEILSGLTSIAENGFIKLSNGLMIQWANFSSPHSDTFTLNFPVAFSTKCFNVIHSQYKHEKTDYDKTTILSISNIGVTMQSSSYGMNYYVVAIGY